MTLRIPQRHGDQPCSHEHQDHTDQRPDRLAAHAAAADPAEPLPGPQRSDEDAQGADAQEQLLAHAPRLVPGGYVDAESDLSVSDRHQGPNSTKAPTTAGRSPRSNHQLRIRRPWMARPAATATTPNAPP